MGALLLVSAHLKVYGDVHKYCRVIISPACAVDMHINNQDMCIHRFPLAV